MDKEREIQFRGKRVDNNEWIFGWLFKDMLTGKMCIQQTISEILEDRGHQCITTISREVIEDTISQYTGRKDKNGIKIFEKDLVKRVYRYYGWNEETEKDIIESREETSYVDYCGNGFWVDAESFGWEGEELWDWNHMEVIGNIFDNHDIYEESEYTKVLNEIKSYIKNAKNGEHKYVEYYSSNINTLMRVAKELHGVDYNLEIENSTFNEGEFIVKISWK